MTIGQLVAQLADTNIKIWHEEDRARANDYADAKDAKREIDQLNQQRNDLIQQIDEAIASYHRPLASLRARIAALPEQNEYDAANRGDGQHLVWRADVLALLADG